MSMTIDYIMLRVIFQCEFRSLASSKMKVFAVIINDWKPYGEIYHNELYSF